MPEHHYRWQGIGRNGERVEGQLLAADPAVARALLLHQGIEPLGLRRVTPPRRRSLRAGDLAAVFEQLSILMSAGLPLAQSLAAIAGSSNHPGIVSLCRSLEADIREGNSLSQALAAARQGIPALIRTLVAAGEAAGRLDEILERVARTSAAREAVRRRIRTALLYPALVGAVALAVSLILLIWVVPVFESLYSDFGAPLPALTQSVLAASDWLRGSGGMVLAVGLISAAVGLAHGRFPPALGNRLQQAGLRLPVLGPILTEAMRGRCHRTLGVMLESGISLLDALDHAAEAMGNARARARMGAVREQVANGSSLHAAMRLSGLFPGTDLQLIAIGEETGTLEQRLIRLAELTDASVDRRVEHMGTALEPLIMLVLGLLVGLLVLAMYLPIFRMGAVF